MSAKSLCITIYKPLIFIPCCYAKTFHETMNNFSVSMKMKSPCKLFYCFTIFILQCVYMCFRFHFNFLQQIFSSRFQLHSIMCNCRVLFSHRARFSYPIIYVIAEHNLFSGSIFHNLILTCTFWGKKKHKMRICFICFWHWTDVESTNIKARSE